MSLKETIEAKLQNTIKDSTNEELYIALLNLVKEQAKAKESNEGKKKLYYISAEFLIGKLLSNNLINLKIYDEVKELLAEEGKSLAELEELELEPSLGNGGLGRLAACFLDSIATLGLNGDGVGLNYHYVCLNRYLKIIFRERLQTHGSQRTAGLTEPRLLIQYILAALMFSHVSMISMYSVMRIVQQSFTCSISKA